MNDEQMLRYAVQNGIIDFNTLQMQVEMNERKKYLEMHNHNIWKGKNGFYYTKLDEENRRRLVKKKSIEEVENEIVNYYKTKENEPTIETVFQKWLDQKLRYGEIQQQTVERYEVDFKRFFTDTGFAKRKIRYVSEIDLEDFVKTSIIQNHLTSKAYGNMRTIMYGMFKYAKKRGYTNISITSFFGDLDISKKSFSVHSKRDDECVFTENEMGKLVSYLSQRPTLSNLAVLFAAYTGMRVGEVVALKWEDIYDKFVFIHRTQIRVKKETGNYAYIVRDFPKTEAGIRKVIIVDPLHNIIKKLRTMNPFTEFVFQHGNVPITKCVVESAIYKACNKTGIPRRSMHALRKTYATRLINSHVDDAIIINQMGHTNIETTRNYYYYNDKSFETVCDMIGNAINYG